MTIFAQLGKKETARRENLTKNERLKSESEPGKGRWKKKHFESRRKKESNNNNNNNKDDGTGDTGEEWGIYMCEGKGNLSIFFFPYLYLSFFLSFSLSPD